jgi:hypothetical protein
MPRILCLVLLTACSAAAPVAAPVTAPVATPPVSEPRLDRRLFRQLRVGQRPTAKRTTFELIVDGDRASLVEIEEREQRALSMAEADREARWRETARRTYRGSAATVSGALQLALRSDGVQPLQLHCTARSVDAAAAGAIRVPSPGGAQEGCDRGAWSPAATLRVAALVCSAGGAAPDDDHGEAEPAHDDHGEHDDHDDRLVFARPPGLEHALVNDGCALRGGGLRIAR